MAIVLTDSKNYENIANVIREKGSDVNKTKTYLPKEIPEAIMESCQYQQDLLVAKKIKTFISNVDYLGTYAFDACTYLNTALIDNVDKIRDAAFRSCFQLVKVSAKKASMIYESAFYGCMVLESASFDSVEKLKDATYSFRGCKKLKTLDFPKLTAISGRKIFAESGVTKLILRAPTVCALNSTDSFVDSLFVTQTEPAYIYVPKALIEQYKVAPNWSVHAAYFKAIEDEGV